MTHSPSLPDQKIFVLHPKRGRSFILTYTRKSDAIYKCHGRYEGAIYHVMNRGDRREDIFLDDLDRRRFVATLAEACEKTG